LLVLFLREVFFAALRTVFFAVEALRAVDFFLLVVLRTDVDFLRVAFLRTAMFAIVPSPFSLARIGATG
jgi:hypothetical protein